MSPRATPAAVQPTAGPAAPEGQLRYEALRRHALEPQSPASDDGLERGFIERQGLAAWLVRAPERLAERTFAVNAPPAAPSVAPPPDRDLIVALTDLIVGDRGELHHD